MACGSAHQGCVGSVLTLSPTHGTSNEAAPASTAAPPMSTGMLLLPDAGTSVSTTGPVGRDGVGVEESEGVVPWRLLGRLVAGAGDDVRDVLAVLGLEDVTLFDVAVDGVRVTVAALVRAGLEHDEQVVAVARSTVGVEAFVVDLLALDVLEALFGEPGLPVLQRCWALSTFGCGRGRRREAEAQQTCDSG